MSNATRIFGSGFIDKVKNAMKGLTYKSGLVFQNHGDEDAASIATKLLIVQRFTQRLVLSMAASVKAFSAHTRDITEEQVQSKLQLERSVCIRPPLEIDLGSEKTI